MEELGPLFVHPHASGNLWILILVFALPTIAISFIVLMRSRLPTALATFSLALLPIFTYVIGNLHVLEVSKNVEFCGSCHETMTPLVESMRDNGETLAGSHYRRGAVHHVDACYECHSGYGIWGGASAKLAGVQHMLHTVTRNFEYPLAHHGAFDIDSCLGCHAGAVPFRAVEIHRDEGIQQALLDREMGCTGACHPPAHPPEALNGMGSWGEVAAP